MERWNILCLALVVLAIASRAAAWTYKEDWPKLYKNCAGKRQSPINYDPSEITYGKSLGSFKFSGYDKLQGVTRVKNNGHALVVDFETFAGNISGTNLPGSKFTLLNLHFHWGADESKGSEHTVEGKSYPMEAHFVHYNTKYVGNVSAAVNAKDGLAVLGVFFKLSKDDNEALNPILKYASNVTKNGASTIIENGFSLKKILSSNVEEFYRNNGSLTTPQCQESVTWTVFRQEMTISKNQLNLLRSIEKADGTPLLVNYRPVQDTNGRQIFATFNKPTGPSGSTAKSTMKYDSGSRALSSTLFTMVLCVVLAGFFKY